MKTRRYLRSKYRVHSGKYSARTVHEEGAQAYEDATKPPRYIPMQRTMYPPGWIVVARRWWGGTGNQLSIEHRRGTVAIPETMDATRCADARELLAAAESGAQSARAIPAGGGRDKSDANDADRASTRNAKKVTRLAPSFSGAEMAPATATEPPAIEPHRPVTD